MGSLVGAVEFGVMPEGLNREGILSRCLDVVEEGGWVVDDGVLRGAGREAIKGLVLGAGQRGTGRRLGWRYVRSGFRLLEAWVKANGGTSGGGDVVGFREIAGELDLLSMPLKALREAIGGWDRVDAAGVEGLYGRKSGRAACRAGVGGDQGACAGGGKAWSGKEAGMAVCAVWVLFA